MAIEIKGIRENPEYLESGNDYWRHIANGFHPWGSESKIYENETIGWG